MGLTYQVAPNFSVDVDSFFGLNQSAPDYNVFVGFGRRFRLVRLECIAARA
jgi:hypothetical protein